MSEQTSAAQPAPRKRPEVIRPHLIGPAFWTVTGIISLLVNLILVAVLIGLGSQIFALKSVVSDQLLQGLYQNFQKMDQAHIRSTIPVRDQTVRANFNLHIETPTTVVLSQDTLLQNATVVQLNTGGLTIYNAPAEILLPAGTQLPILLNLDVPVDQEIPVNLDVSVDIPLSETDLHEPFAGLQAVLTPYIQLLEGTPDTWDQAICGPEPSAFCIWFFSD
jgi:hypothetical protein